MNNIEQNIQLEPLQQEHKEQFVKDIQISFQKTVVEEFGNRNELVLPEKDVLGSLKNNKSQALRIIYNDEWVGGLVLLIDEKSGCNSIEFFYINPTTHNKGVGALAWQEVEKLFPNTKVWKTYTPYFEKRNIHFYVNKCGFQIVEFFNSFHKETSNNENEELEMEDFFRFEKRMK